MVHFGVRLRAWSRLSWFLLVLFPAVLPARTGQSAPAEGAGYRYTSHVYKTVGRTDLKVHLFLPSDVGAYEHRPAVIFFHGGGWHVGEPKWCFPECKYFASRGLVAVSAQYRLADNSSVTPLDCMADAKSAIRWVRSHAAELRIDSDRIVAAGSSSGGHLAAATAMIDSFDEPTEDGSISSAPDALLLWFPAVDLARDFWFARLLGDHARVEDCSPCSHVRRGLPPLIVFQGDQDDLTPIRGARLLSEGLTKAGNRCELNIYPGRGHLFTNDPKDYADTIEKADRFLASLGYLEGQPYPRAIQASRTSR